MAWGSRNGRDRGGWPQTQPWSRVRTAWIVPFPCREPGTILHPLGLGWAEDGGVGMGAERASGRGSSSIHFSFHWDQLPCVLQHWQCPPYPSWGPCGGSCIPLAMPTARINRKCLLAWQLLHKSRIEPLFPAPAASTKSGASRSAI